MATLTRDEQSRRRPVSVLSGTHRQVDPSDAVRSTALFSPLPPVQSSGTGTGSPRERSGTWETAPPGRTPAAQVLPVLERIAAELGSLSRALSRALDELRRLRPLSPFEPAENGDRRVARIIRKVCDHFGITRAQLLVRRRRARDVWRRNVALHLAAEFTDLSLEELGTLFARTKTGVYYALRATRNRLDTEPTRCAEVRALEKRIRADLLRRPPKQKAGNRRAPGHQIEDHHHDDHQRAEYS
jgi:Bacterial dnaA protein helix-turn-helix